MLLATGESARVSVALCTCNGARYVEAQLRSIERQTRRPDALVVVDDASTDGTPDVVRRFASGAGLTVRLEVNRERLGTAANFERALGLCEAGIVLLADQDDVWVESKVERMLAAFADPRTLLVHSNARTVDESMADLGQTLADALGLDARDVASSADDERFSRLLCRNVVTGCTAAIRSDLLGWARPFPPGWLHDEWLAVIAASVGRIAWIEEPLVLYRQHGGNQLGVTRHQGLLGLRRLWQGRGGARATYVPRFEKLVERLELLPSQVSGDKVARAREALTFARFRAGLSPNRLMRIIPIARELLSGRYGRYGRGTRTAVVDMIETIVH